MKKETDKLPQLFNPKKYIGMEFNGYKWFSHYKGVHSFQKRTDDKYRWMLIECTEKQLYNGDVEFMTENSWTLNKEIKRETNKSYVSELYA